MIVNLTTTQINSGGGNDFIVTLSWDAQQEMWVPDYTYSRLAEEYDDGKTIVFVVDDADATANGHFESASHLFIYYVRWLDFDEYDNLFVVDDTYILSQNSGLELDDRLDYRYVNNEDRTVTPSESQQTVTFDPSEGYSGLGTVTVSAISSSYVGSGITRRSSSDLTANGATVTTPSGYYENNATKTVASGTAGTPTATKGTVSNHAVSVTPSVTNTTGYITGGTKTGSTVTVSASELVSGSETITTNGTHDVTNFATVEVDIPAGGANVGTKTSESLSSTVTTLSIPGLSASPVMWALQNVVNSGSYFSGASTRYITSCLCSGGSTVYSLAIYKSGSTAREYGYTTCTWSYSNGTITITSPGTSTAGGFRTGSTYRLFYAY